VTADTSTTSETPATGVAENEPEGETTASRQEIPKEVAAALKKANKEAEALRLKVKEFEDRDKTEAERALEARRELESRVEKAEREALRLRVIAEIGLDSDLHEFVTGDTEEEIRAKAEKLKARATPSQDAAPTARGIDQGSRSAGALPLSGDPFERALKNAVGIP
jgi:hypothetical protein